MILHRLHAETGHLHFAGGFYSTGFRLAFRCAVNSALGCFSKGSAPPRG